jgi:hypothetical protein
MPGVDGIEATRLMRAYEDEQGLPRARIVSLTSSLRLLRLFTLSSLHRSLSPVSTPTSAGTKRFYFRVKVRIPFLFLLSSLRSTYTDLSPHSRQLDRQRRPVAQAPSVRHGALRGAASRRPAIAPEFLHRPPHCRPRFSHPLGWRRRPLTAHRRLLSRLHRRWLPFLPSFLSPFVHIGSRNVPRIAFYLFPCPVHIHVVVVSSLRL